jgi:hypothetical protein
VSAEQRLKKTRLSENHKKLANEFNEYFASVGKIAVDKVKRLAEVNNIQIATPLPTARHLSSLDLFEFRTVTPHEVRTIILNSPSNKAPGADKINIQFIKDSLEVILDPVTDIINCFLNLDDVNISFNVEDSRSGTATQGRGS